MQDSRQAGLLQVGNSETQPDVGTAPANSSSLPAVGEAGEEVWLVGERRVSGEQKYYLANLPGDADLQTLAATIKARWVCEQAHQQLKEELGLDHFEGRSWQGLHRHVLMAMIAYAFLQHRRLAAAAGGKKNPARPASADAAGRPKSHRRRPGAPSALQMPALPKAYRMALHMILPK
jgi:SRSO17 transposase